MKIVEMLKMYFFCILIKKIFLNLYESPHNAFSPPPWRNKICWKKQKVNLNWSFFRENILQLLKDVQIWKWDSLKVVKILLPEKKNKQENVSFLAKVKHSCISFDTQVKLRYVMGTRKLDGERRTTFFVLLHALLY